MYRLSLVVENRGASLAVACGLFIAVASPAVGHGLESTSSAAVAHGPGALRRVGSSQARDRPVTPALAGGFLTTELPGKPHSRTFLNTENKGKESMAGYW